MMLAASAEGAEREADSFVSAARHLVPSATLRIGTYWKRPEYREVFLDALVQSDGLRELEGLMKLIGVGWTITGDSNERSAVWEGSGTPLVPSLRWANIELFPATA